MRSSYLLAAVAVASMSRADPARRASQLDPSLQTRLVGRWTNPVDHVIVEISSIDLATGRLAGKEAAPGSASDQVHDLVGWINDAPAKDGWDHVVPITFSTALHEYGTLPVWAGFLRGDALVTMHYLVWPTRTYPWDHVTTGQETWTKLPAAGEWRTWSRDRKRSYMEAIVLADARTMFTAYDARRFAAMTCKTCHGKGAELGDFKLPNPALPALDPTFEELERDQPAALAFMRRLTARSADLVGDPSVGCFSCHARRTARTPRATSGAR